MTAKILTANRLRDGIVVYLRDDGEWSEAISKAAVARAPEDDARLLETGAQAVADQQVVEPYLIDVTAESGPLRPVRFREAIRAAGPTVETMRATPATER